MKLSLILGLTLVTLSLSLPSTHAWFSKHIMKKDVNETVDEGEIAEQMFSSEDPVTLCNDYGRLSCVLRSCQNLSFPDYPETEFILDALKNMCGSEAELRACFGEKVAHCDNQNNLTSLLDETFSYCVGDGIPSTVETFLDSNKDVTLDDECLDSIFNLTSVGTPQCNVTTRPPCGKADTLEDSIQMLEDIIRWYVKCFMTTGLDEIPVNCDVTRRTAYSIMVASVQLCDGYGINHYEDFDLLRIVE